MIFSEADWEALWITIKLAVSATVCLLIVGTPLAWWLARSRSKFRPFVDALVALPLILPPTVLGFYLLICLGPDGAIGSWVGDRGLAFTFAGLVIGSMVYSLPFVVQPIRDAFASIGEESLEAAATLGANGWDRFATIVLPMAKRGFVSAIVLGFAHTIGEFGVVLMIGGNIPGETQVLSIAIYEHVESLEYANAHWLSGTLLAFSFLTLVGVYFARGGYKGITPR